MNSLDMSYKIEIYEDPLCLPIEEAERLLATLPQWRKSKVMSYRNQIDRNLSLLAYHDRLMEREYGIAEQKINDLF